MLSMFVHSQETVTLTSGTYTVDTIASYPVGPGTQYTELRLLTGAPYNKRLDVFYTTVDATQPTITFEGVLSGDSIVGCERPSNMAKRKSDDDRIFFTGTNGDFYYTSGDIGLAIGNNIIENEFAHTPNANRTSVAYGADGRVHCGLIIYRGKVRHSSGDMVITNVNHRRGNDALVLYNKYNGHYTKTDATGTEMRLRLCDGEKMETSGEMRVVVLNKEENKGNTKIEEDEMVLSGHGASAVYLSNIGIGDTLVLDLESVMNGEKIDVASAVSGDPHTQMVLNGAVEEVNIWVGNNPHTGIGTTYTGDTVIFCVVDGRGFSNGCTSADLGHIMVYLGAYNAVDFDGGGSSTLYVNEFDHMNNNSDGKERSVCNAFFAVSNTPKDTVISTIAPYASKMNVARYSRVVPKFLGYNQYGVLVDTLVEGVEISCDASLGVVEGETFTATGSEDGVLVASYGAVSTEVNIILTTLDGFYVGCDTLITDNNERVVSLKGIVGDRFVDVDTKVLNITSSDTTVCVVEDGIMLGKRNGESEIIYEKDGLSDTVVVKVEIAEEASVVFDVLRDSIGFKVKSTSSKWNAEWNRIEEGRDAYISFTYTGGRAPFVRIEREMEVYSIPDSVTMTINSTATIAELQNKWSFNGRDTQLDDFANIPVGEDYRMTLYSEDMVESWNQSLFPIRIFSFNFNLQGSEMDKDEDYFINIKDITAHYRNVSVSVPMIPERGEEALVVYPNPLENGEVLFIETEEEETIVKFYNLKGQMVLVRDMMFVGDPRLESGKTSIVGDFRSGLGMISIDGLDKGSYIVKVGTRSAKIVVR